MDNLTLSRIDQAKLELSSAEILDNLDYLEKNALTGEQLKHLNKVNRAFHQANKENKNINLSGLNLSYA